MPDAKFLSNMGKASLVAALIFLSIAYIMRELA